MILQRNTFQFTNTHKPVKLTVLYQFRIKSIRHLYFIPVVGGIPVPHQNFYFIGTKVAVNNAIAILEIAKMIFIFTCRQMIRMNKIITNGTKRLFVHEANIRTSPQPSTVKQERGAGSQQTKASLSWRLIC